MESNETYIPLEGEGEQQVIRRTSVRHECEQCGRPAEYRHTYLLENARRNPASTAYGRDDCGWCSDHEIFTCEDHKRHPPAPDGYGWCSTFPLQKFPHMGLYWREEKIATDSQIRNGAA